MIVSWPQVQALFDRIGRTLPRSGAVAIYGRFNYGGRRTSESNARFDLTPRWFGILRA
jgi:hypothetical protein